MRPGARRRLRPRDDLPFVIFLSRGRICGTRDPNPCVAGRRGEPFPSEQRGEDPLGTRWAGRRTACLRPAEPAADRAGLSGREPHPARWAAGRTYSAHRALAALASFGSAEGRSWTRGDARVGPKTPLALRLRAGLAPPRLGRSSHPPPRAIPAATPHLPHGREATGDPSVRPCPSTVGGRLAIPRTGRSLCSRHAGSAFGRPCARGSRRPEGEAVPGGHGVTGWHLARGGWGLRRPQTPAQRAYRLVPSRSPGPAVA